MNLEDIPLRMQSTLSPPEISIVELGKIADRDDFLVRITDEVNNYEFRVSMTGTIVAIWNVDPKEAVKYLVDRLVYSHGTANTFAEEGFWFDSNNSQSTVEQTLNAIDTDGWQSFNHPSIKTALGSLSGPR